MVGVTLRFRGPTFVASTRTPVPIPPMGKAVSKEHRLPMTMVQVGSRRAHLLVHWRRFATAVETRQRQRRAHQSQEISRLTPSMQPLSVAKFCFKNS